MARPSHPKHAKKKEPELLRVPFRRELVKQTQPTLVTRGGYELLPVRASVIVVVGGLFIGLAVGVFVRFLFLSQVEGFRTNGEVDDLADCLGEEVIGGVVHIILLVGSAFEVVVELIAPLVVGEVHLAEVSGSIDKAVFPVLARGGGHRGGEGLGDGSLGQAGITGQADSTAELIAEEILAILVPAEHAAEAVETIELADGLDVSRGSAVASGNPAQVVQEVSIGVLELVVVLDTSHGQAAEVVALDLDIGFATALSLAGSALGVLEATSEEHGVQTAVGIDTLVEQVDLVDVNPSVLLVDLEDVEVPAGDLANESRVVETNGIRFGLVVDEPGETIILTENGAGIAVNAGLAEGHVNGELRAVVSDIAVVSAAINANAAPVLGSAIPVFTTDLGELGLVLLIDGIIVIPGDLAIEGERAAVHERNGQGGEFFQSATSLGGLELRTVEEESGLGLGAQAESHRADQEHCENFFHLVVLGFVGNGWVKRKKTKW